MSLRLNQILGGADIRSPIFYDSNDTNYYIDAASTSVINILQFAANTAQIIGNTSSSYGSLDVRGVRNGWRGIHFNAGGNAPHLMFDGSANGGVYFETGGRWASYYSYGNNCWGFGTSTTNSAYNIYAPTGVYSGGRVDGTIFYDSNDSTYYVDPASFSLTSSIGIGGLTSSNNVQMYDSYVDASSSYLQSPPLIIRKDSSATGAIDQAPVGLFIYNLNGTNNTWTKLSMGSREAAGAGNTVSIAGLAAQKTAGTANNWATGNLHFWTKAGGTQITNMVAYSAGYVQSDYSFRSPIFYDSNNTSYYLDPASTSNLNVVNLVGITGAGNAYIQTTSTGTSYTSHFQIREASGGGGNTSEIYAPALGFHWSGVVASNILMESSGRIAIRNNPGSGYENFIANAIYGAVFYDSNDVTYYTDPSSLSNILELKTNKNWYDSSASAWGGGINMGGNNPTIGFQSTSSTWWYMLHHASSNINFYRRSTSGSWNHDGIWDSSGNFIWQGSSVRAPIFYDQNNTAYYIDAASTSNLNAITAAGNITAAQYYTGGWFRNNGSGNGLYNESTGQHFYSDSANYWNVASSANAQGIRLRTGGHNGTVRGYFYADTNNDVGFLNQDGSWRLRVVGGDYALADGSSMRAQIFYDSNDTSYYVDAASTSILNRVNYQQLRRNFGASVYSGPPSGSNIVKTFSGVLVAGSANGSTNTYTVIETSIPQGNYQMGGFTIKWFENYSSTNAKTTIEIAGYWNPTSNGGFIGFEFTSSNPNVQPTIQVGANASGNTVFILTHYSSSYPVIVARDLWFGYNSSDAEYGTGWTMTNTNSLAAYSNIVSATLRVGPTLTGTGASGTWGISITGSSASCTGNSATATTASSCSGNSATATTATSSGSINSDTGNVGGNRLQYWQLSEGTASLNPTTDWYNAIRMGHGDPVTYYSNTLAVKMTGSNLGDIYTRTTTNGTPGTWNRFWNNNNDGAGSGLDADLLDGINSASFLRSDVSATNSVDLRSPIFYDSSNTAYYLDPASQSKLYNLLIETGTANTSMTIVGSNQPSIFLKTTDNQRNIEIFNSYGNFGIYRVNSPSNYIIYHVDNGASSYTYFQLEGTARLTINSSGSTATTSVRSPIFYDSDDTNYYVDAASTSRLNLLRTRNTFGERATVTSAASTTVDTQYNVTELTMSASITTLTLSNIQANTIVHMWTIVTVGNGTAYSITWPAAVKWPGGTAPTITSTNTKRDIYQFVTYDGGTNIYAIIVGQNL
jgi:hypothetical protein